MSKYKGPIQIGFDVTNRCNFRCLHCFNESGEVDSSNELNDKEVEKLFEEIIEIKPYSICFCGGEPLLRPELVLRMSRKLNEAGISQAMVTNGYLLSRELVKDFKKAGIDIIQISVDGNELAHNKLRGNNKSYEKAVAALELLNSNQVEAAVAFSPTSWNIDDFLDVYKICEEFKVKSFRVQKLMPIGRAANNNEIIPTDMQYRKLKKMILQKQIEYMQGTCSLDVQWGDPLEHVISFLYYPVKFTPFYSIKSNGDIAPSTYIPYIIGNIRKHSLCEYWEGGLENIWSDCLTYRNIARHFLSVGTMNPENYNLPMSLVEKDLRIDLIEDRVL